MVSVKLDIQSVDVLRSWLKSFDVSYLSLTSSSVKKLCFTSRCVELNLITYGDRSLAYYGPNEWNILPLREVLPK